MTCLTEILCMRYRIIIMWMCGVSIDCLSFTLKRYYNEIFIFFSPTVFLKNVKYRCKLRGIIMNRVRLNFFCLDVTLPKSQKHVRHTGIKSFSFLCRTLRIVGQKVSTKSFMAASLDSFPSSSSLLLHEDWNLVPNNNNTRMKETKIWLPFKTWCSLSVPRCAAYHKGN